MRLFKVVISLTFWVLALPAWSGPADLSALTAQLAKVRATHGANDQRDAGPELTPVKQALREWIEPQLPLAPEAGADGIAYITVPSDLNALGVKMSLALDAAGLTCGHWGEPDYRCGDDNHEENERGFVDQVRVTSFDYDHYLLVVTGVGVRCGFDQSAYLYTHGPDRRWRLVLSIEQDRYGDKDYRPENFLSIAVSPSGVAWNQAAPPPLVTAIGYGPWCTSNWHELNTRLWRVTPAAVTPRPVLDRNDELYMGNDFIAGAQLTDKDLLVQFEGGSIDGDILIRTHVLHYSVGPGDRLARVSPIALSPGDFVDEWLSSPWVDAATWLARGADREALKQLHETKSPAEFDGTPRQCRKDASLWQVNFAAADDKALPTHVLVRWRAPYEFAMVAVSHQPFSGCDKNVTLPSNLGTLFPQQGWIQ